MHSIKKLFILGMLLYVQPAFAGLSIFTCEPEWASLAEEIGAGKIRVYSATTGKQDPHHIEARPSLISKARRADLLLCTGAELEQGWLPVLLKKSANPIIMPGQPGYLMAADHVPLLDKPASLDRSMGDVHAAGNPHVHLDPHNILTVAKVLTQRLMQLDAGNADVYQQSMKNFSDNWTQAMTRWEKDGVELQGKAMAVNHKSWVYLAHWLKLDLDTTLEPYPGVPPTAEHLSQLINVVQQKHIGKILYSAHSSARAANWLAEKTGVPAVELPYTVGGSERVGNLYQLFDETLRLLKE